MPPAIARSAAARTAGEVLPAPWPRRRSHRHPRRRPRRSTTRPCPASRSRGGPVPRPAWPTRAAAGRAADEGDTLLPHPPERPPVRALERVERRRVQLHDVVGRLERTGERHHDPLLAQLRRCRRRDGHRAGWPAPRSRGGPGCASPRSRRRASARRAGGPRRRPSPRSCPCPGRPPRRSRPGPPAAHGASPRSRSASGT